MADSSVLDLGIEQFATTVVENGSIRLIVPKKNVFTTYCRKVQLGFFFFFVLVTDEVFWTLNVWNTRIYIGSYIMTGPDVSNAGSAGKYAEKRTRDSFQSTRLPGSRSVCGCCRMTAVWRCHRVVSLAWLDYGVAIVSISVTRACHATIKGAPFPQSEYSRQCPTFRRCFHRSSSCIVYES